MSHAPNNSNAPSVEPSPEEQGQPRALALATGSAVDLSQYSDLFVLRVIGEERPEFVDILAGQIDKGRTDAEIIRIVCEAGGSPQAMRYAQKILRALRNLPNNKLTDAPNKGPSPER